jgi:hypothetical protein
VDPGDEQVRDDKVLLRYLLGEEMFEAKPTPRLRHATPGQEISLHGDGAQRVFVVGETRPDGYVQLYWRGYLSVTACSGHPTTPCTKR